MRPHSSSLLASTHAHSSTPVPPSRAPFDGRSPQLSASHRPTLKRKWSSFACACCSIWPKERGKYAKFCCSYASWVSLLRKLKDARRVPWGSGRKRSRSLYPVLADTYVVKRALTRKKMSEESISAWHLPWTLIHRVKLQKRCCWRRCRVPCRRDWLLARMLGVIRGRDFFEG